MARKLKSDKLLFTATLLLVCTSVVMVYSSSALLALEKLSRDHPGDVNEVRPLLHEMVAHDGNEAVRRLAVVALKNGSARPDTIQILRSLGEDDEQPRELRESATKIAQLLRRKSGPK